MTDRDGPTRQAVHGKVSIPGVERCPTSWDNATQCPDCRRRTSTVSEQQRTTSLGATICTPHNTHKYINHTE